MRIFIVLLVGLLAGCDSDESIPDYNAQNIEPKGSWATNCYYTDEQDFGIETWGIDTYTFDEGTVKNEVKIFTDEDCEVEYDGEVEFWTGSLGNLTFIKHVESSNGLKANWYEYSYIKPEELNGNRIELGFYFDLYSMNTVYFDNGSYFIINSQTYYQ